MILNGAGMGKGTAAYQEASSEQSNVNLQSGLLIADVSLRKAPIIVSV